MSANDLQALIPFKVADTASPKIAKNPNLIDLESTIEETTGIKVFIRNKKNNAGQVTFEYKNLDQLNRLIMVIKANY